jgi:hypothetical protein
MLTQADFPNGPAPVTYEAGELLARLKAVDVLLVGWFHPVRGLQIMPIGNAQAVREDTMVYEVPDEYAVAVLMATKQLLDEGNEAGAYACLAEIADENRRTN